MDSQSNSNQFPDLGIEAFARGEFSDEQLEAALDQMGLDATTRAQIRATFIRARTRYQRDHPKKN